MSTRVRELKFISSFTICGLANITTSRASRIRRERNVHHTRAQCAFEEWTWWMKESSGGPEAVTSTFRPRCPFCAFAPFPPFSFSLPFFSSFRALALFALFDAAPALIFLPEYLAYTWYTSVRFISAFSSPAGAHPYAKRREVPSLQLCQTIPRNDCVRKILIKFPNWETARGNGKMREGPMRSPGRVVETIGKLLFNINIFNVNQPT